MTKPLLSYQIMDGKKCIYLDNNDNRFDVGGVNIRMNIVSQIDT